MTVKIYDFDQTHIQIDCDDSTTRELWDFFSFEVPGAKFMKKYQEGLWDGKIHIFRRVDSKIYKGLKHKVIEFLESNQYEYEDLTNNNFLENIDFKTFYNSLNLPFKIREYQKIAFEKSLREKRICLLSPTSSGKSLISYLLIRYLMEHTEHKILVTVPTVQLLKQLKKDFIDYDKSYDIESHIHLIYANQEKYTNKRIIFGTWQSLYKMPPDYFDNFQCIIADECHTISANCIKGILENAKNTEYKIGMTGTLDETKCDISVIEGLTGKVFEVTKTKKLMENKEVSQAEINVLVLKHTYNTIKEKGKTTYQEEMKFLYNMEKRNKFIKNLSQKNENENTLILVNTIEHLEVLYEMISKENKNTFKASGDVDVDIREDIREFTENNSEVIIIATFGVFSTGINIKNLQNLIFAGNSKAKIKVLQSIGRLLRLDGKTDKVKIYDIADDLSIKSFQNYSLRHMLNRINIYAKENHSFKIINIPMKD